MELLSLLINSFIEAHRSSPLWQFFQLSHDEKVFLFLFRSINVQENKPVQQHAVRQEVQTSLQCKSITCWVNPHLSPRGWREVTGGGRGLGHDTNWAFIKKRERIHFFFAGFLSLALLSFTSPPSRCEWRVSTATLRQRQTGSFSLLRHHSSLRDRREVADMPFNL